MAKAEESESGGVGVDSKTPSDAEYKKLEIEQKLMIINGGGCQMPTLSVFYGIIITMYPEIGGRHNLPHFHADYQGRKIAMTFDGEILEGDMPVSKLKLISAWAEIHKEDLIANWSLLSEGNEIFKIEPLR